MLINIGLHVRKLLPTNLGLIASVMAHASSDQQLSDIWAHEKSCELARFRR